MPDKNTVLLLSHVLNENVKALHEYLLANCRGKLDVVFLADNSSGVFSDYKNDEHFFLFTVDDLQNLNYSGRSRLIYPQEPVHRSEYSRSRNFRMGVTELPLLHYYKARGGCAQNDQHYWVIEYDVRFTGNWLTLFSHFAHSPADLLGTSLVSYSDVPEWPHWSRLQLPEGKPGSNQLLKGFFPVYRLSKRALIHLDQAYQAGASGHYECLVPTVLQQAGLMLEDIGGDGPFTRAENINRFYQNRPKDLLLGPGTFVFRPIRSTPGNQLDTLWHPVKSPE